MPVPAVIATAAEKPHAEVLRDIGNYVTELLSALS